jgi:hypothetical protein
MRKQGTCALPGDRTGGKGTVMFEALQSRAILRRQFVGEIVKLRRSSLIRRKPRVAAGRGSPGLNYETASRLSEPQLNQVCKTSIGRFIFVVLCAVTFTLMGASLAHAQNPAPSTENLKKTNTRPAEAPASRNVRSRSSDETEETLAALDRRVPLWCVRLRRSGK